MPKARWDDIDGPSLECITIAALSLSLGAVTFGRSRSTAGSPLHTFLPCLPGGFDRRRWRPLREIAYTFPSHRRQESADISRMCVGVVCCAVVWCSVPCRAVPFCGVACCTVLCCGVVWCGVVRCCVVWCGDNQANANVDDASFHILLSYLYRRLS